MSLMFKSAGVVVLSILSLALFNAVPTHSQSGRQQEPPANPPHPSNTRPQQTKSSPQQTATTQTGPKQNGNSSTTNDPDDVVRVSSHLVPVPATVLDARGAAVTNLRLEDFELAVDGEPKLISDIYRAETPVRLAMLFDNIGSLDSSREFEKRAAM